MEKYNKGDKVTVVGSNGKVITWVATGDEQRDAAISIQIEHAVECLDWSYGATDIEDEQVDCSGLTKYLYSLVDVEISSSAKTNKQLGITGQHDDKNGERIYTQNVDSFDIRPSLKTSLQSQENMVK